MAIIRLDKVRSGLVGHIESVVNETEDMLNGYVFHLGDLVAGERELSKVKKVTAATLDGVEPIVMLADAEAMKHPDHRYLEHFKLEKGKIGRAFFLDPGDVITMTADLFTDALTVGRYAIPATDGSMKLSPSADGTAGAGADEGSIAGSRLVFKVIGSTKLHGHGAYELRVVKS